MGCLKVVFFCNRLTSTWLMPCVMEWSGLHTCVLAGSASLAARPSAPVSARPVKGQDGGSSSLSKPPPTATSKQRTTPGWTGSKTAKPLTKTKATVKPAEVKSNSRPYSANARGKKNVAAEPAARPSVVPPRKFVPRERQLGIGGPASAPAKATSAPRKPFYVCVAKTSLQATQSLPKSRPETEKSGLNTSAARKPHSRRMPAGFDKHINRFARREGPQRQKKEPGTDGKGDDVRKETSVSGAQPKKSILKPTAEEAKENAEPLVPALEEDTMQEEETAAKEEVDGVQNDTKNVKRGESGDPIEIIKQTAKSVHFISPCVTPVTSAARHPVTPVKEPSMR